MSAVAATVRFENAISASVLLNTMIMAMNHHNMADWLTNLT